MKNVACNNGRVGMWGVSYGGFYVSAGMIDAHPALVAVSPQAPVTDYYLGDDSFHNGAFMLAANLGFCTAFEPRVGEAAPPPPRSPFDRNPQVFTDLPKAKPEDFKPATQRVYRSAARPSSITLMVETR